MVLEFIEGKALGEYLKAVGPQPFDIAVEMAVQILRALETAHTAGIIHRDIKPDNVMVVGESPIEIKILDFGIVTLLEGDEAEMLRTKIGSIRGTPSYMAPELFSGTVRASVESDLFAVGLVLAECITGAVCVSGMSLMQIAYKQVHEPLRLPGFIPTDLANVILKCCEQLPAERYHSPVEVIDALLSVLPTAMAQRDKFEAAYLESIKASSFQRLSDSQLMEGIGSLNNMTIRPNNSPAISRNWFFVILALVGILGVLVGGIIIFYMVYGEDVGKQSKALPLSSGDSVSELSKSADSGSSEMNLGVQDMSQSTVDNGMLESSKEQGVLNFEAEKLALVEAAVQAASAGVSAAVMEAAAVAKDEGAENPPSEAKNAVKPPRARNKRTAKKEEPPQAVLSAPLQPEPAPSPVESAKDRYKGIPLNLLD